MSRRQSNPTRRFANPFAGSSHSKSRISPLLPLVFLFLGGIFFLGYFYRGSGLSGGVKGIVSRIEGDFTCTYELQRAIPVLKKAHGDSMHKVLHVGPDTCSVVSKLLKEDETEAWGIEPYDIEDADEYCKRLVSQGSVRVADIKFPLPYRPKSFSRVIISDALEYLSPRYLNKTLPDLARVSSDGIIIFTGFPGNPKAKVTEPSRYGRPAKKRSMSWWVRFFVQNNLEEHETAHKKFINAAIDDGYKSGCQIFHLKSFQ